MLSQNNKLRALTGVDRFHRAGYTGDRAVAATGECVDTAHYNANGRILSAGVGTPSTGHAAQTAFAFFEVAPDATLYSLSTSSRMVNGKKEWDFEKCLPLIDEKRIGRIFFSRVENSADGIELQRFLLKDRPWLLEFWAAGNDGETKASRILQLEEVVGVAACAVAGDAVNPAHYTSHTKHVDLAAPGSVFVNPGGKNPYSVSGTSFATPWLCGMACLVDDFFIHKTGAPLSREAMRRFLEDHAVDVGQPGRDDQTGLGLVVLPEPETIDIWKYQTGGCRMIDQFKDKDQVSPWAVDGVEFCLRNGYLNGKGECFDPKGTLTREEACTIIRRVKEGAT